MKTPVIICGYPKSGTTWLSRLTAELLDCPLAGNWGFDNKNEPMAEGLLRDSPFVCYKSHHLYHEIPGPVVNSKLVYIIRDPRDVTVSGARYFRYHFIPRLQNPLLNITRKKINRLINKVLPEKTRFNYMIKAITSGNKSVDRWCAISWGKHVQSFMNHEILILRYEDLLHEPEKTCSALLQYLQAEDRLPRIQESVQTQSFEVKKRSLMMEKKQTLAGLLREGKSGSGVKKLSGKQQARIVNAWKGLMTKYGYI